MNKLNWDDTRCFLAVARAGQMLGAARHLGTSQSRLSRHIGALEQAVGAQLLDRTPRGCSLTPDGEIFLEAAERMEAEMLQALDRVQGGVDRVRGTVRIGAPDGFGAAFLSPRLGQFRETHPDLHIQLVPMPRTFSLSEREADVAIMVGRPDAGRLRVRKLTDYSLSLYAAQTYLDRSGTPSSADELRNHTLVGYVDDLIHTDELVYNKEFLADWKSQVQVSTAVGQFEAVRAGAGIGILHDFMARGRPELVRLWPQEQAKRSYWTVWHENQRVSARVLAVVEILDLMVREDRRRFLPDD
ncbi:MAG: LysR family transcriptional regulator [Pseudomonadota bacterium]